VLTLKTLKPGQKGTKDLLARYGASLLCVRYRYDELTRQRVKTVELIVQRRPQERGTAQPPVPKLVFQVLRPAAARSVVPLGAPAAARIPAQAARAPARRVALRIDWREADLRRRVKSAGGWWDPERRVWLLRRDQAHRLDLLHRVVGGRGA
jgi:hypothetical protein